MRKRSATLSDVKAIIEHAVCISRRKPAFLYGKEANALAVALLRHCNNVKIIMKTDDNDTPVIVITVVKFLRGGELIIPIREEKLFDQCDFP